MSENFNQPEVACEPLIIQEIKCLHWRHPSKFPYDGPINAKLLGQRIIEAGEDSLVSMDSKWFYYNPNKPDKPQCLYKSTMSQEERNFYRDVFVGKNRLLLLADFSSPSGANMQRTHTENIENDFWNGIIWAAAGLTVTSNALMRKQWMINPRKQLIRTIFMLGGAGIVSFVGAKSYNNNQVWKLIEELDNCQLKNNRVLDPFNADVDIRTGLVLAKQSQMRDLGYLVDDFKFIKLIYQPGVKHT